MYNYHDESTRHSLLSQMLNDQGAQFIDEGNYQKAIDVLIKALKLYEGVANARDPCSCHHCRLETCITRSKRISKSHSTILSGGQVSSSSSSSPSSPYMSRKGCHHDEDMYYDDCEEEDDDDVTMVDADRQIHSSQSRRHNNMATMTITKSTNRGGYIYRHPIYCSPTFSHEKHHPGITLLVIIIFNLALSYHLVSISCSSSSSSSSLSSVSACEKKLTKALQLYEFFYQLQMERNIFSTQAMLAVANNVGEIHRVVGNHSKYTMCLEHLTSCLMLVVEDQNSQRSESSSSTTTTTAMTTTVGAVTTVQSIRTNHSERRQQSHSHHQQNHRMQPQSEEMRGYWKNASKAILHNNCAGAA